MALAGGPTEPKVGELGEERSRNATLVEGVEEVGNDVGQNESHRQREQRCRRVGATGHEREGDRPKNTHNTGGSKRTWNSNYVLLQGAGSCLRLKTPLSEHAGGSVSGKYSIPFPTHSDVI